MVFVVGSQIKIDMKFFKGRIRYLLWIAVVIPIGLGIRRAYEGAEVFCGESARLLCFLGKYLPDTLYASMVYLGFRLVFLKNNINLSLLLALVFCLGIELSQFYHAPWIDGIRANKLGGLILGYSFLWFDLLCYSAGILTFFAVDRYFEK